MLKKRILILSVLTLLWIGALPMAVNAQAEFQNGILQAGGAARQGGLFTGTLTDIITNAINWIMGIAAVLALAAIVWGGINYILALGNESKAEKAKEIIIYAVIGLLVIGASFVIISIVKSIIT